MGRRPLSLRRVGIPKLHPLLLGTPLRVPSCHSSCERRQQSQGHCKATPQSRGNSGLYSRTQEHKKGPFGTYDSFGGGAGMWSHF